MDDADTNLVAQTSDSRMGGLLRTNPGRMPTRGHFSAVLEDSLDRLDKGDKELDLHVLHCTEEFVTFYDGYPKSSVHLLAVPRRERVLGLGQLAAVHLPMLQRLAAYVAWLMQSLEAKPGDVGIGWTHGIHSVPSLRQLHVHVFTQDLCSPCLKNAKHFGSFRPPFLVSLDDAIDAVERGLEPERRFGLRTAEEDMKKRSLRCHRCDTDFGRRFAELKKHLATCQASLLPGTAPRLWRVSEAAAASDRSEELPPQHVLAAANTDSAGSDDGQNLRALLMQGGRKRSRDDPAGAEDLVDLT
ncbi:unnamed protein product [Polarella glacialis]|uniref:Aprataxin C2HE/C2H2/C2HC zinc finger domain-containing protein n=1 Tax=Polarella glacialis TaxID=89957 RepID=A0A813FJJ3_POLGL|nr:unnamed protein product [Polarella glacialis]